MRIHKKFGQKMVWDVNTEVVDILDEAEGILETFSAEDVSDRHVNNPVLHMTGDAASQDSNMGGVTGGPSDNETDRQLVTLDWEVNQICGEVLTSQGRVLRPPDDDGEVTQVFSEFIGPGLGEEELSFSLSEEEGVEAAGTVRSPTV